METTNSKKTKHDNYQALIDVLLVCATYLRPEVTFRCVQLLCSHARSVLFCPDKDLPSLVAVSQRAMFERHAGRRIDLFENWSRSLSYAGSYHCFVANEKNDGVGRMRDEEEDNDTFIIPRYNFIERRETGEVQLPIEPPLQKDWAAMFLGKDVALSIFTQNDDAQPMADVSAGSKALKTANTLPTMVLLRNIIRWWCEEKSSRISGDVAPLVVTAVRYGISGVVSDVLAGCYSTMHDATEVCEITIIIHGRYTHDANAFIVTEGTYKCIVPPFVLGAMYGNKNIVKQSLLEVAAFFKKTKDLGSLNDVPFHLNFLRRIPDSKGSDNPTWIAAIHDCSHFDLFCKLFGNLAGFALFWSIVQNLPEMVKCLVQECKFQFRWLTYQQRETIFDLLHGCSMDTYYNQDLENQWRGNVQGGGFFSGRHEKIRFKRTRSYEEKQRMLKLLIELGIPKNLDGFVPVVDFTPDLKLQSDGKNMSEAMAINLDQSMSDMERSERMRVHAACITFNGLQSNDEKTLYLHDFLKLRVYPLWEEREKEEEEMFNGEMDGDLTSEDDEMEEEEEDKDKQRMLSIKKMMPAPTEQLCKVEGDELDMGQGAERQHRGPTHGVSYNPTNNY